MIGDFIITFNFNREIKRIQTPAESQYNFNEIKDGFWLDQNRNLCREDRGKYWIPGGQIVTIEVLK